MKKPQNFEAVPRLDGQPRQGFQLASACDFKV
jgi:hypothetical protein